MSQEVEYQTERLDHLGIVAGVCQEAGIAEWLDKQAGENRRSVSVGTATVAMVLNGLGFSNRQLYLVPQYFENKPVEHLLGEGITADMLNDDCLGRTLDWLYEHDVTTLFAGLALQARRRFGIAAQHLHIDTTSFSVNGDYASKEEGDPVPIAITYGYSRDHREDLKQWMLALATTHDGDVPIFLRPLDGNSSDKEHLSAAVKEVMRQLREQLPEEQEQRIAVFDSGGYSRSQYEELQRRQDPVDQSCARNLHCRKNRTGGSGRAVATALRWVRGLCGTHNGVASRKGTVGDRAHPCTDASRTGADGQTGEENPAGVGKTPLAPLHSSLWVRNGCAPRLGKGSQRKTILAEWPRSRSKNRSSISNVVARKKRPRLIKRSGIWSPNLRWISTRWQCWRARKRPSL